MIRTDTERQAAALTLALWLHYVHRLQSGEAANLAARFTLDTSTSLEPPPRPTSPTDEAAGELAGAILPSILDLTGAERWQSPELARAKHMRAHDLAHHYRDELDMPQPEKPAPTPDAATTLDGWPAVSFAVRATIVAELRRFATAKAGELAASRDAIRAHSRSALIASLLDGEIDYAAAYAAAADHLDLGAPSADPPSRAR